MLFVRRPAAVVFARWAFVASALWTLLAVGFNLAPTDVYPWWRWRWTIGYGAYALAALLALSRVSKKT
jgi:hypothetical protein